MYADLPDHLQRIVREYLMSNEFKKAKEIHDLWMTENRSVPMSMPSMGWQRADGY